MANILAFMYITKYTPLFLNLFVFFSEKRGLLLEKR